jgi:hypothetical protein
VSVREALSLGLPVLASRVGVRPAGVRLFEAGDVGGLTDQMTLALAGGAKPRENKIPESSLSRLMEIYRNAPQETGSYDAARIGA